MSLMLESGSTTIVWFTLKISVNKWEYIVIQTTSMFLAWTVLPKDIVCLMSVGNGIFRMELLYHYGAKDKLDQLCLHKRDQD